MAGFRMFGVELVSYSRMVPVPSTDHFVWMSTGGPGQENPELSSPLFRVMLPEPSTATLYRAHPKAFPVSSSITSQVPASSDCGFPPPPPPPHVQRIIAGNN